MGDFESLSHSKWACKYDAVFITKGRRKVWSAKLRQHFGENQDASEVSFRTVLMKASGPSSPTTVASNFE